MSMYVYVCLGMSRYGYVGLNSAFELFLVGNKTQVR